MSKLKLTDNALEKLVTLTIINERFLNLEKQNPKVFQDWGRELQRRYLNEIEPVLKPFAGYSPQIKSQMELREKIYKRQVINQNTKVQKGNNLLKDRPFYIRFL